MKSGDTVHIVWNCSTNKQPPEIVAIKKAETKQRFFIVHENVSTRMIKCAIFAEKSDQKQ